MKKINFFNPTSDLFPFRWFILIVIGLSAALAWYDMTGGAFMSGKNQQSWGASGPGYHK